MELYRQIEQALKDAIRERSEVGKDAVRMLLTALKLREKEMKRRPGDDEIRQVISTLIKQRRDSAEQYKAGGRPELADKEEEEIGVLQAFLPEQLSPDELEKLVDEAISESGAASPKEIGKVMKILVPKTSGRAEGKQVNELVRRKLGG